MKVTFYYRRPNSLNRSIERVFEAVEGGIVHANIKVEKWHAKSFGIWPFSMIANIFRCWYSSHFNSGIHHITGDIHYCAILMPPSRTVLTVHDLVSLHDNSVAPIFRRMVYYLWYRFPLKRLKYITCISATTANDLISMFPFAKEKVYVIENPVSNDFFYIQPISEIPDKPVILHIGTRSNKNLVRVIRALKGMNCHLRIIGELSQEQKEELRDVDFDYSQVAALSDNDMLEEYRNSHIVSFPSTFEGFGMPILEAQASGRPVLTSNIDPMKTVAGEAAVLVNPLDVEDIRSGFKLLLTNPVLITTIVAKGLDNAKKYSVSNIANRYKDYYNDVDG